MYPPIFDVCARSPAVTALLGESPTRLYPFGEAPEGVSKPYAVWQTIGGEPDNYLADRPDSDRFGLQIDVYGTSATQTRNVAKTLRDAIELKAYVIRWNGEFYDATTKTYRYSFDVDWWVTR
ncbi:DUF3168 domain-containing protein [Pseudomonas typographi]|uniref:DUF3168 domain-containing protein n=1 Tax=Pseudomonas typographi TaxID=2715964 RepID=UPI001689498B|nr:DUF3168 domain-containing protein [Pseudomonas typographi]MBD1553633.1 DUF3168 domain-containing protein [Pseudomonas typographi]